MADNYCLPDFLFDRSPGNKKKTNKGSRLLLKFSSPTGCHDKSIDRTRDITFGRFLGIGLWFTPLGEPSRLLAGCIAVRFQIIDSRHHLIRASAPRAFLVSTCCDQRSN